MIKTLTCGIIVSEFEFLSRGYFYFGKGMNSYPSCSGLNSTITVLEWWFWHYITMKGWYAIKQTNQTNPLNLKTWIKKLI